MLEQIIVYIITTILGIALGVVSSKLKKTKEKDEKEKKKDEAIELGVQALLRNEIIRRYREYFLPSRAIFSKIFSRII